MGQDSINRAAHQLEVAIQEDIPAHSTGTQQNLTVTTVSDADKTEVLSKIVDWRMEQGGVSS
jgi:hypothetical protein